MNTNRTDHERFGTLSDSLMQKDQETDNEHSVWRKNGWEISKIYDDHQPTYQKN